MRRIRADAAALPGEAEEYVTVFRAALPAAMAAGMRSLDDITNLTDSVAAIGHMRGIDAPQVGRDMSLMLRGQASRQERTFNELLPDIQRAAAQQHLGNVGNSQQFNRLTGAQRVSVLQGAAGMHRQGLEAAGQTLEAQWGTLMSTLQEGAERLATPIVARLTAGLARFNGALSGPVVERVTTVLGGLLDAGMNIVSAVLPPLSQALAALVPPVMGLISAIVPHLGPIASGLADVAARIGAGLGPIIRDLTPLFSGLLSALGPLLHEVGPLLTLFIQGLRIAFAPIFLVAEAARRVQDTLNAAADNARGNARLEAAQRANQTRANSVMALEHVMGTGQGVALARGLSDKAINALGAQANDQQLHGLGEHYQQAYLTQRAAQLRSSNTALAPSEPATSANARGGAIVSQTTVHVDATGATDPQAVGEQTAAHVAAAGREHVANVRRLRASAQ
jgi:hypothetical protein